MRRTTIDDLRSALPELDELRPFVEHAVSGSTPDEERAWAGSGVLGSVGSRLVDDRDLEVALEELVDRQAEHLSAVYRSVLRATRAIAAGQPAVAASAFLDVFALEESRDRPERAEAWADAAVRAVAESGDTELRALALRRRGRARRACGRYAGGLRDYERAFEIAEAVGDRRGAAEAAIGAGNLVEDEARWDAAERWYRRALDVLADLDVPVSESWHAWLNIHVVQRSRGEVEGSVAAMREAERLADAVGDEGARVFIENAWGQWFMARGEWDEAVHRLRVALDAASATRARVTIRLNLAEALLGDGRLLDAVEQAREAERDAIVGRVHGLLPEVYRLLGRAAAARGSADAFVFFERSLALIEERGLPTIERARTLEAYGEVERANGNDETADDLVEQARSIYEQLGVRAGGQRRGRK